MAKTGSSRFNMNASDWKSVGKGVLIAGVGAGLVYAATWATGHDFGSYTPAVAAFAAVVVNVVRKFVADYSN